MESYGGLAQLGERLPCKQEVSGSIPLISTKRDWLKHLERDVSLSLFEIQELETVHYVPWKLNIVIIMMQLWEGNSKENVLIETFKNSIMGKNTIFAKQKIPNMSLHNSTCYREPILDFLL